jgi:hypothetical protein
MRAHEVIGDLRTYRKKYVSLIQLAEYLVIPRRTIYHHVSKGALPVVKRVGVIRVHIADACRYAGVPPPS